MRVLGEREETVGDGMEIDRGMFLWTDVWTRLMRRAFLSDGSGNRRLSRQQKSRRENRGRSEERSSCGMEIEIEKQKW